MYGAWSFGVVYQMANARAILTYRRCRCVEMEHRRLAGTICSCLSVLRASSCSCGVFCLRLRKYIFSVFSSIDFSLILFR